MFEFFAMIFTFGALFYEVNKSASKASQNKAEARENGQKYYWDGSKRRSVETGEILTYHGGKLCGVKTNRVYVDFEQDRIDKMNEKGKQNGSPTYWGHCKKRYDSRTKSYSCHHIRECETDKMYKIDTRPVMSEEKPWERDYSRFRILYLDEDFKLTGESKILPSSLRAYYSGIFE